MKAPVIPDLKTALFILIYLFTATVIVTSIDSNLDVFFPRVPHPFSEIACYVQYVGIAIIKILYRENFTFLEVNVLHKNIHL